MTSLLKKAKATAKLIINAKSICNQKSYYPDEPRKSTWHVFLDQLFFIWEYGNYEKYYFAYGFDRINMGLNRICKEYIINEKAFLRRVDYLNDHPVNEIRHGRCIIADKYYFYLFLNSFNIPTPKVLYYTRNKKLFYSFRGKEEGIGSILVNDMDAFAKPMGGQLGNGAFAIRIENGLIYVNGQLTTQVDDLVSTFTDTNYVIQERVIQHSQMSQLCSTAVNTIRLITVMTTNEDVIALRAGLRIGREGSNVDNCARGGVFVGIDLNSGKLLKRGIIKPPYGTTVFQHPDSKIVFDGFEIPFFKEALAMAKELHSKLYRIHSIGWDIAITPDGPMFIEGNSKWEVSGTQSAEGGVKFIEQYFK